MKPFSAIQNFVQLHVSGQKTNPLPFLVCFGCGESAEVQDNRLREQLERITGGVRCDICQSTRFAWAKVAPTAAERWQMAGIRFAELQLQIDNLRAQFISKEERCKPKVDTLLGALLEKPVNITAELAKLNK